jgi:hypothetical protein
MVDLTIWIWSKDHVLQLMLEVHHEIIPLNTIL